MDEPAAADEQPSTPRTIEIPVDDLLYARGTRVPPWMKETDLPPYAGTLVLRVKTDERMEQIKAAIEQAGPPAEVDRAVRGHLSITRDGSPGWLHDSQSERVLHITHQFSGMVQVIIEEPGDDMHIRVGSAHWDQFILRTTTAIKLQTRIKELEDELSDANLRLKSTMPKAAVLTKLLNHLDEHIPILQSTPGADIPAKIYEHIRLYVREALEVA